MKVMEGEGCKDSGKTISVFIEDTVVGHHAYAEPRVVKFGYKEFIVSRDKWMAVCKKCNKLEALVYLKCNKDI